MGKTRSYSITTIKRLYANSGNLCCMYGCNQKLINDKYNISKIAHIASLNATDIRYDPTLTETQLNDYDNLILLCPNHHDMIDAPANKHKYTIEYLKDMKKAHEEEVSSKRTMSNFNDDNFNIRIETLNKDYIEIIEKELKKAFEFSGSFDTYEHRKNKGYYHYKQGVQIKNNDTNERDKYITASISEQIVKKSLQFITKYGKFSLDDFVNMFFNCSGNEDEKEEFKRYILNYAWKEDKQKVIIYLKTLENEIKCLKSNKVNLLDATQKVIDITNKIIVNNNNEQVKHRSYIKQNSDEYILTLEKNIKKFKDEYITFEEVTEIILNITYHFRENLK